MIKKLKKMLICLLLNSTIYSMNIEFKEVNNYIAAKKLQDLIDNMVYNAQIGDINSLKWYLDLKLDVNAKNREGMTALHAATTAWKFDVVKILLKHNADMEIKDNEGNTALKIATGGRKRHIAQLLASHGAKFNDKFFKCSTLKSITKRGNAIYRIFKAAKETGNTEDIRYLAFKGYKDYKILDDDGFSPLHYAIQNDFNEIAMLLLSHDPSLIEYQIERTNLLPIEYAVSIWAEKVLRDLARLATEPQANPIIQPQIENIIANNQIEARIEPNNKTLFFSSISAIICLITLAIFKKIMFKKNKHIKYNSRSESSQLNKKYIPK